MLPLNPAELAYCASLPIIAALIGWFTNYLAVKMIFRPLQPVNILGLKFQGLVPKRHAELARKIADTVETHLISNSDVEEALRSNKIEEHLVSFISLRVDSLIKEKAGSIPLIGMFMSGDITDRIQGMVGEEIRQSMPALLDGLLKSLDDSLDFRTIVYNKVLAFELDHLEKIIYEISARELKTIELLGGVLGFIVGLVQAVGYLLFRV